MATGDTASGNGGTDGDRQFPGTAPGNGFAGGREGWRAAMSNGDRGDLRVEAAQLAAFLADKGRTAGALLVAFIKTLEDAYLHEALERFPTDRRVLAYALMSDTKLDDERGWLGAFRALDPENALTHYLSALYWLRRGEIEPAIADIERAAALERFDVYARDGMEALEALYLFCGYSPLEAKWGGILDVPLLHLSFVRELEEAIEETRRSLKHSGNEPAAAWLAAAGAALGMQLGEEGRTMVGQLVGLSIETRFLGRLGAADGDGILPQPVQELIRLACGRKVRIMAAIERAGTNRLVSAREEVVEGYLDRFKTEGEEAAARWLLEQAE